MIFVPDKELFLNLVFNSLPYSVASRSGGYTVWVGMCYRDPQTLSQYQT